MEIGNAVKVLMVAILFLIIGLAMGSTVVTTVQNVNTTGWTYSGHEAVEDIIDLFPLVYYIAIVLGFLGLVFAVVKIAGIA